MYEPLNDNEVFVAVRVFKFPPNAIPLIVLLANLSFAIPPAEIPNARVPEVVIGEPDTVNPFAPVAATEVTVPRLVVALVLIVTVVPLTEVVTLVPPV